MSPKLPVLSGKEIGHLLEKHGFFISSQKGSHAKYSDANVRTTIVPMHSEEDIGPGLLLKILSDAGIDPDSLRR
jgi:predicted RNA binding protein YcfA (HicA-like mRNA interferase family)